MSPEKEQTTPKTCPTCGTRLSENASRCLVCGRTFTTKTNSASEGSVQNPKLPELKIGLPAAIGLAIFILGMGAALIFVLLRTTGRVTTPTETPTPSVTPTLTLTPSPTLEPTNAPTATTEPPLEYIIKDGDYCSSIALMYGISIQSIVSLNNLPPDCGVLSVNQKLLIPRPTPTATPQPTATLSEAEATEQACGTVSYQIKEGDTLSSISLNYNISMDSIKNFNGLTSDNVLVGMYINLPLCERRPTQGPTPTATPPPPYPAASLLLPADGTFFTNINDSITLQWSAVGTLRENEAYAVTVEDVTSGGARKVVEYTRDTKFIVPSNMRPTDGSNHVFRWSVVVVRQTDTTSDGQPVYSIHGIVSIPRVFGWSGQVTSSTQAP